MKTYLSKVTDDELIKELEKRGVKNELYGTPLKETMLISNINKYKGKLW